MDTRYNFLLLFLTLLFLSCSVKRNTVSSESLQNVKITDIHEKGIEKWDIIFFESKEIKKGIILSAKATIVSNSTSIEIGKSYELHLKRLGIYPPDTSQVGLLLYGNDVEIVADGSSFIFHKDIYVYTTEGLLGLTLKK